MDSTNFEFEDSLLDVVLPDSGYVDDGQDTSENFAGLQSSREFPGNLWIDPDDWKDAARENDRFGTWAETTRQNIGRFTNQSPTHECTCHSLIQGAEAAYRVQSGFKYNIALSPISVYAEANPRQWGGANCLNVLRIAMERGFLPEPVHGQSEIFEHTLHGTCGQGNENNSRGDWVPLSQFPDGWKRTAGELKPIEAINPRTIEQCVCLILAGYVVNVGRNGHAVPWNHLVWRGRAMYFGYADSYDIVRYDSWRTARGAVGGASSITLMSTPATFENAFYDGTNDINTT